MGAHDTSSGRPRHLPVGRVALVAILAWSLAACAESVPLRQPTTVAALIPEESRSAISSTTAPSTSLAAIAPPSVVLERRDVPREDGPVWLHAVAADGARIVAVGGVAEDFLSDAAVWMSPDGATWSRVEHDESVFGDDMGSGSMEANQYMADVIVGTFGILAVGVDGRAPEYDAATWASTDGTAWRRSDRGSAPLGGPGSQVMWSVVASGDRFVAVGESAQQAAVWISDDGLEWTAAVVRGAPGDSPAMPSALYDVIVGGPGFLAAGSVGTEPTPALWVSADGATWDRLRDGIVADGSGVEDADVETGRMTRLAAGDELVAVASTGDAGLPSFARPAVWTSVDGFEWRRTATHFEGTPVGALPAIGAIETDGDLAIAVGGYEGTVPGWSPGLALVWISTDGGDSWAVGAAGESQTWVFGPLAYPVGAVDVVRFRGEIVIVGNDMRPTGEEINGYPQFVDSGAIWVATIAP